MVKIMNEKYDVIVIGSGHAGCEACLASARMGHKTLLLTLNLDSIAFLACNPSIGGTAKGHLVCEIDALGGEMGNTADNSSPVPNYQKGIENGTNAFFSSGGKHSGYEKQSPHRKQF